MVAVWGVIHFTLALVILLYERNSVNDFFDSRLQFRIIDILAEVRPKLPGITDDDLEMIAARHSKMVLHEQFALVLYAPGGEVVASTHRPVPSIEALAADAKRPLKSARPFRTTVFDLGQQERRTTPRAILVDVPMDGTVRYRLLAATTDTYATRMLARLREVLLASILAGLVGASVGGWLISGLATAPLRRLLESMKSMSPDTVGTAVEMRGGSEELAVVRRELDAMRSRMQEGFKAQERFISNVSHEIKTPISVLLTEMQTIPTIKESPPEVQEFVVSVREELRRLGGMVESFLLLTRVRDGKPLTAIAGAYQVNELIMDCVESCAPMAGQHSVVLDPRLISDDEQLDLSIHGVPDLLRTMLDNLVRNAIRFSPADGRVTISAGREGDRVHFVVRDEGPGIPPTLIDKVFDRFAQAESEERRGRGHGLGLAIAQGIAELHGGNISVENCPDRGCCFTVMLPVAVRVVRSSRLAPDQEVEDHPDQREQKNQ